MALSALQCVFVGSASWFTRPSNPARVLLPAVPSAEFVFHQEPK